MKKSMVYIQSGGPTAVINTSLYGAIKEAQDHSDKIDNIYGSLHGIEGLIDNNLIDLNKETHETIELLQQTPGAALGTTRFKLPKDFHDPLYERILATLERHNIGYVFINGGNDTMDTCHKLSLMFAEKGVDIKIIGVPKTIDNDLACTDHSLGFGSAAKSVANNVKQVCIDASCYKKGKVFIIEVMGRNAGWLTAAVDLLPEGNRPDFIYLPENTFDTEQFLKDVKYTYERKGHCIVAISEGIIFERDTSAARVDGFGHIQLGGAADDLAKIVEHRLDLPTRSIELSLVQRSDAIMISRVDHEEAIKCSEFAVQQALKGQTGQMVAIRRLSSRPYKAEYFLEDISKIANAERTVPFSMIYDKTCMTQEFRDYCEPLIEGGIDIVYENGIIKTAQLKKYLVK